jgi:peptidoglycan/LPS O-acetylase OafA/YrhL
MVWGSCVEKYKNLDGLRGVAALVVVICHYGAAFIPSADGSPSTRHFPHEHLIASTPLHLPFAGNFAVCIFFVLSGFVLSNKFFRTNDQSILISSAVRRYFRLMMPAFVSVLLAYLVLRLGLKFNMSSAQLTGAPWLASFWNFPAQLGQGLWEGIYSAFFTNTVIYNPTLWTMKYELYGSFLIFLFLSLFGKLDKRWVFYAAFCFIFLNSYYLPFILGVILSDVWVNLPTITERVTQRMGYLLLLAGLLLGGWFSPVLYPSLYNHFTLPFFGGGQLELLAHTLGAFCTVIAVLNLRPVTRLLEIRPIQYLGHISFSLYLVHFIVLGSLASYLFAVLMPRVGYAAGFLITFSVAITATFALAHYYSRFIDAPSIKVSKLIGNLLLSKNRQAIPSDSSDDPIPLLPNPGLGSATRLPEPSSPSS